MEALDAKTPARSDQKPAGAITDSQTSHLEDSMSRVSEISMSKPKLQRKPKIRLRFIGGDYYIGSVPVPFETALVAWKINKNHFEAVACAI